MAFRWRFQYLLILLFFMGIFLVYLISQPKAVEIIIEYNVTQNCTGTLALALNPSTVTKGGSVTATASGLSTCGNFTVFFRNGSCSGSTFNSCKIPLADGGCAASFTVNPTTVPVTWTVYACVDKNNNSAFDSGEYVSQSLNIVGAIPSVSSLGFYWFNKTVFLPAPVNLAAGSITSFIINATITSSEGASSIASCRGYLWNTSSILSTANARYTNSSCALTNPSGNTVICSCIFNLNYYDVNGTWRGNITGISTSSVNNTNGGTFTINPSTALWTGNKFGVADASNPTIQFTGLAIGSANVSASSNPAKVINYGNTKLTFKMNGTDHVGKSDPSFVLLVGNLTYNSTITGFGTMNAMTYTPVDYYPTGGIPVYPVSISGIPEPAMFYINYYLSIPVGMVAQNYAGSVFIQEVKS